MADCELSNHDPGTSGGFAGLYVMGTGAEFDDDGGFVTLTRCSILRNNAENGGAAVSLQEGYVTLNACNISDNTASSGNGYLVYVSGGTLNMIDCVLTGNKRGTGTGAGGLIQYEGASVQLWFQTLLVKFIFLQS